MGGILHRRRDWRLFDFLSVPGCAGVADFASLCRNLPGYLAEVL
jgi:hypothetical protein